jgi:hypothetical protein
MAAVPQRLLTILLVLAPACFAPALAQQPSRTADSVKAATVRRLLQLTGSTEAAVRSMEAVIPAHRAASPQIPAAFWDAFIARVRHDLPQLVDSFVPIYASRFTQTELDQLVQFYESPLGKHLIEVQPEMFQEGFEIGRRWGALIARQVTDSLRAADKGPP